MNSTITHNIPCSRCPRIDSKELTIQEALKLAEAKEDPPAILEISFKGFPTVRQHLCAPCREVVNGYLGQITRELTHKSSIRTTADGDVEEIDIDED